MIYIFETGSYSDKSVDAVSSDMPQEQVLTILDAMWDDVRPIWKAEHAEPLDAHVSADPLRLVATYTLVRTYDEKWNPGTPPFVRVGGYVVNEAALAKIPREWLLTEADRLAREGHEMDRGPAVAMLAWAKGEVMP